jgi:hypothetical protein
LSSEVEALESGAVSRLSDRVETLRALRAYADSLGLPGDAYVLLALDLWPTPHRLPARRGDTGRVPVVSVTSAPAGRHSPTGTEGSEWTGEGTGVTDATITGMVEPHLPVAAHDTGHVPRTTIDKTGETPAIGQQAPRLLRVLVGVVALLVVLAGVGLAEHQHVTAWAKDVRTTSSHWVTDAKQAVGLTSKTSTKKPRTAAPKAPPKVDIVEHLSTNAVTINVHAASFTVKMAAFKYACWIQATDINQLEPIYSQVLPGGQTHTFVVTNSMTIETASSSGRAYVYEGSQFIGYYFPARVPFTMTFNAVG